MRYSQRHRTKQDKNGRAVPPSAAERERMVAVAAYFIAERRGFAPGGEQGDWHQAEQQIDRMLAAAVGQNATPDLTPTNDDVRNAIHLPQ
jgi:hypothetical protein